MKRYTYGVNEQGLPLGEALHRAKLSDADVDRIRDLYEEGFVSYPTLAKMFGVKKATIADICTYRKRSTTPAGYRTIKENEMKRTPPASKFFDEHTLLDLDQEYQPEDVIAELGYSGYRAEKFREDLD